MEPRSGSWVLTTEQTAPYLSKDSEISLLFKETEVILARDLPEGLLSLQNKIKAEILQIQSDGLLSEIKLGTAAGPIIALIDQEVVGEMELQEGMRVTAMVKENEITLSS